ncbi:hypothetical protein C2845_PM07G12480 [Panicum miliaceum]|uniref:RNase H type-1 domain-containing protein n=1 Tax=Panicum miliaceum TaxID=4540 RepID=A0A3L6SK18_PANMI|nr:hypothetical protein C2845_PM07G12480 [Panicum miliaceum]
MHTIAIGIIPSFSDSFLPTNRGDGFEGLDLNSGWNCAYTAASGQGRWGFIIRDEGGNVIHAAAGKLARLRDALQEEMIACSEGARAAADRGICNVIFETDSLILKQAMEDDSYWLAPAGGAIYELKQLIQGSFSSFDFVFAPRSCNKVAHALAALGCSCSHESVLSWDGVPSCTADAVASDCAEPLS